MHQRAALHSDVDRLTKVEYASLVSLKCLSTVSIETHSRSVAVRLSSWHRVQHLVLQLRAGEEVGAQEHVQRGCDYRRA